MMTPTKDDIREKIEKRDRLEAELRAADRDLIETGRAYWEAQGCRVFPRVGALRSVVS